jgi:hypothetical protein
MKNILTTIFLFISVLGFNQKYIIQGEYYWDIDPGEGNGTSLSASDGNFDEALEELFAAGIDVTALTVGAHSFNVRVKGNDGSWSNSFKQTVFIDNPITLLTRTTKVTQSEYYWNNDPGVGNGTPLLASDGNFDEALEELFATGIDVSALSVGAHNFSIRVKGNEGVWSNSFKQTIFIDNPVILLTRVIKITQGEYYWDADPGVGSGTSLIALDGNFDKALEELFVTGIDVTSLTVGAHNFSVRVKGIDGLWSNSFKHTIFIDNPVVLLTRTTKVTQGEYYWNADPGEGSGIPILAIDGSFDEALEELYNTNIPTSLLLAGAHNFSIRIRSQDGSWSKSSVQTIYINDPFCKVYDTIVDSICMGNNYSFDSQTITASGSYNDTIVVANNCDTVRTLVLKVNPILTPTISVVTNVSLPVCKGETLVFSTNIAHGGSLPQYQWKRNGINVGTGLSTYSPSANLNNNGDTIICVLTSNLGCIATPTALDTLTLQLINNITYSFIDSICMGDSLFFGGVYYKAPGIYVDTVQSTLGCDSIVTLAVSIKSAPIVVANVNTDTILVGGTVNFNTSGSSVSNYLWDFGDGFSSNLNSVTHTYNAIGVYKVILEGNLHGGCFSYDTLTIVVINTTGITANDIFYNNVSVYPNPVSDILTVKADDSYELSFELISSDGEIVKQGQLKKSMQIDVSNFSKGIYYLTITSENKIKTEKVVVK